MPPRFAYWTILVDNQPTSFRSSAADDLLPTFNRLKAKNPSAVMMWFQGGKLWPSRLDAQEAMRARGDIGRKHDPNQTRPIVEGETPRKDGKLDWKPAGAFRPEARGPRSANAREEAKRNWKPKPYTPKPEPDESSEKPEWKPKGSFKPEFKSKVDARPEWRAKSFNPKGKSKSEWKPKGSFKPSSRPFSSPKPQDSSPRASEKPEWKPKGSFTPTPRRPRPDHKSPRTEKPEWKPAAAKADAPEFRNPKPEIRDRKKWRPGGDHQDPRQKYKDAKKAKWTRFKKTIRARSSKKKDR